MGREVRMVPADWQHPKDGRGRYVPMDEHFPYNEEEIAEGLRDGWLDGEPPHYGMAIMPDWPAEQRTHLMLYETMSEGTPCSPAFATPEELAHWLADNGDGSRMHGGATYEQWLAVCRFGWAPSMVMDANGLRSGVEAMADLAKGTKK